VPFIERFFNLAQTGAQDRAAGYVGVIVSNSFMKREFGKKLIEEVLPQLDLTHVVDCSGAHIPGHGTPTAILLGRNRGSVASVVRTVRAVRGELGTPEDPAHGAVWTSIVAQTDLAKSESEFISTEDTPRVILARHPWNMGGGGAGDAQSAIEGERVKLRDRVVSIGVMAITGEDEVFSRPNYKDLARTHYLEFPVRTLVEGDAIRDWCINTEMAVVFPYTEKFAFHQAETVVRLFWPHRTTLAANICFGKTRSERGLAPTEFGMLVRQNANERPSITFAFVATHNHFALDRSSKVFKQSAPIFKLSAKAGDEDFPGVLGLLNSSTACFWMRQVCHNKVVRASMRAPRPKLGSDS
jgi:hypothetical protein